MRVTFLSPYLKIAGGTRVILTHAHNLTKRGHLVTVVVRSKHLLRRVAANFFGKKPDWFPDCAAKILRVKDFSEKNLPDGDVIVATASQTASLVNGYSERKGRKFYFIQHDERLYHNRPEEAAQTYRYPLKKIVVSTWLKEIMAADFGSEAEVLLNTVDRDFFYPLAQAKEKESIRILMLHHDYEWKGVAEGVEIVSQLKKQYPNLKLILYGARQKKIDLPYDEYYFDPPQKDLAKIFLPAIFFCVLPWDEGFGLPLLEAMACRCAVATYDNGGSRDFAFDGRTAMVAQRRNKDDLKNKLESLIKDKNLREKISRAGYEFVSKMPSWEEQAQKLEDIFKKSA